MPGRRQPRRISGAGNGGVQTVGIAARVLKALAAQGGSVTFTVVVKPGINPADTNLSVTGNFSSIVFNCAAFSSFALRIRTFLSSLFGNGRSSITDSPSMIPIL